MKSRSPCSASRTYSRPTPYSSGYISTATTSQFNRTPNTADRGERGKKAAREGNRDDHAHHHRRQPHSESELCPDQPTHQRIADLGLLLHLDAGAHHARAAAVCENNPFALRSTASHLRAPVGSHASDRGSAGPEVHGLPSAHRQLHRRRRTVGPHPHHHRRRRVVRIPVTTAATPDTSDAPAGNRRRPNGIRACSTVCAPGGHRTPECSRA